MERVEGECLALRKLLHEDPSCKSACSVDEIPSHVFRLKQLREGCLIAHSVLTLIEAQHVANYFKEPLYRVLSVYGVSQEDLPKTPEEAWSIVLSGMLLHDVGKLCEQYLGKEEKSGWKRITHHQISGIICKKALSKMTSSFMALVTSYAVLFHHEAIDWRRLEKEITLFTYIPQVLYIRDALFYDVDDQTLNLFKRNTLALLQQLRQLAVITDKQYRTLEHAVTAAIEELSGNQKIMLRPGRELEVSKVADIRYITPALAIYRLLYLADNRAASARSLYWRDIIKDIDWQNLPKVAQRIVRALERDKRRRYYIGISSIPPL